MLFLHANSYPYVTVEAQVAWLPEAFALVDTLQRDPNVPSGLIGSSHVCGAGEAEGSRKVV